MKMEKKLEDYLHLYLGCDIFTGTGIVTLVAFQKEIIPYTSSRIIVANGNEIHELKWGNNCKIILRPLSSMTEEEINKSWELLGWNEAIKSMDRRMSEILMSFDTYNEDHEHSSWSYFINVLPYWLSIGIDLFDLIPSGLAIDKNEKK